MCDSQTKRVTCVTYSNFNTNICVWKNYMCVRAPHAENTLYIVGEGQNCPNSYNCSLFSPLLLYVNTNQKLGNFSD